MKPTAPVRDHAAAARAKTAGEVAAALGIDLATIHRAMGVLRCGSPFGTSSPTLPIPAGMAAAVVAYATALADAKP